MLAAPQSPLTPLQVSMLGRRDSLEVARQRTPCGRDDQGQPTLCSASKGTPSAGCRDGADQPVRKGPHTAAPPAKDAGKSKDALTPARHSNAITMGATPPPSKSGLAIRSLGLSGSARRVRPGPAHPIADRSSPIALNREASGLLGMSAPKSTAPCTPKSALRAPARRVVSTEAAEHEFLEATAEAAGTKAAMAEAAAVEAAAEEGSLYPEVNPNSSRNPNPAPSPSPDPDPELTLTRREACSPRRS